MVMTVKIDRLDGGGSATLYGSQRPTQSDYLAVTDMEDWYSQASPKTEQYEKFRGHGDMARRRFRRKGVSYSFKGFHTSSDRQQARNVKDIFSVFGWEQPVRITVKDGEQETWREAEITIQYEDDHGIRNKGRWTYTIECKSADPLRYGAERNFAIPSVNPPDSGLVYPLFDEPDSILDFAMGASEADDLFVLGTTLSYPKFVVRGTFPMGFALEISGRRVEYAFPTVPNQPVTIDMKGRVMVGGSWQQDALVRREWTALRPGVPAVGRLLPLGGVGQGTAYGTAFDTYI